MNECKGLFGKWFGHNFQRYLIKNSFRKDDAYQCNMEGIATILSYVNACRDEYEIRCKRCGVKTDE